MYLSAVPDMLKVFLPSNLEWRGPSDQKAIYLTFDDGPIPEVTPWVLDTLNAFNVKATFFCVGDNVRKHPEVFSQVLQAGHKVGNHSFNHLQAWKTSRQDYLANVRSCRELVESNLFRPPHGQITRTLAKALKDDYRIIMWSLLTRDFDARLTPGQCLRIALRGTKPGSIVVFHDSLKARERLEYALPRFLKQMRDQGFNFRTL
jgi:peptidoglycan/xylan/chitin deacetylase (PgdA/CDA1 family)